MTLQKMWPEVGGIQVGGIGGSRSLEKTKKGKEGEEMKTEI